jgi:hypothetical protein
MSRFRDRQLIDFGTGTIRNRDRLLIVFRISFAFFRVRFGPFLMGQNTERMSGPLPVRLPFAGFQNDEPAGRYQAVHEPVHGVFSATTAKPRRHVSAIEVQHTFLVGEFAA